MERATFLGGKEASSRRVRGRARHLRLVILLLQGGQKVQVKNEPGSGDSDNKQQHALLIVVCRVRWPG